MKWSLPITSLMPLLTNYEANLKNASTCWREGRGRNKYLLFSQDCYLCCEFKSHAATKLIIINNGSIKVEGDFEIVDKDGNAYGLQGRTILSLCRCGRSANKPFCDGSHKEHFEHDAKAFELPPKKVG